MQYWYLREKKQENTWRLRELKAKTKCKEQCKYWGLFLGKKAENKDSFTYISTLIEINYRHPTHAYYTYYT